jgi:hypothetical protein
MHVNMGDGERSEISTKRFEVGDASLRPGPRRLSVFQSENLSAYSVQRTYIRCCSLSRLVR